MPLLDPAMFDPATYAPGITIGGGWLRQFSPEATAMRPIEGFTPSAMGGLLANPGALPGGVPSLSGSAPPIVAGVPLPRPRPEAAEDDEEDPAATPKAAAPAQGQLPANGTPFNIDSPNMPQASSSMLDRVGKGLSDNSNLLIALGAGLAGAPSWGAGISRALTGAGAVAEVEDKKREKAQLVQTTFNALRARGYSPSEAMAAAQNPEVLKVLQADRDFSFRQQEARRVQSNADRTFSLAERTANRADESPAETATQRAKAATQFGLVEGTPAYKTYVLTGTMPASNETPLIQQAEQRKAIAAANGITPDNPAYSGFVLTGKMPREDAQPLTATDKQAILEADEAVLNAKSAIDNLKKAKDISPKALGFRGAGTIANIGSSVVPSGYGGDTLQATADLDNLVTSNALTQLKSIFGGNPTEGERAILLQIQGSSSLPDANRQKIFDRAIAMAEKRMKFNQQRADELRGGNYYKNKNGAKPDAAGPPDPLGIL